LAVRLKSALCAGVVTLLSASAAVSAEICVACRGPDAKYACVVNTSTAGTIDTVVKLYCITALAKAGPHASCAIDRNTKAPCQGVRKELPLPGALEQALDNPQEPQTATPALSSPTPGAPGALPTPSEAAPHGAVDAGSQPAPQAAKDTPPKTVQEMMENGAKSAGDGFSETQKSAGKAAKSTTTALEKAGSAVGSAAKTSWKCLSSFFSNCSSSSSE
jgi:hypothetical protein